MNAALKQTVAPAAEAQVSTAEDGLLNRIVDAMNKVAERQQSRVSPIGLKTFAELERFAERAARSTMVPKDYLGKPDNIILAVQLGSEIGLAPMQALQNVSVIGGRPSVWGDAMLALCRRHPLCEDVVERVEGTGDAATAFCLVKRRGATEVVGKFSVADAKKAGLWGKAGPWQQYPTRMLQMRARAFALRDAFPDVLKGLHVAEEVMDIPAEPARAEPARAVAHNPAPPLAMQEAEPHDPTAPEYRVATNAGGKMFHTRTDFINFWTGYPNGLIARCEAADALDKLKAAREMNLGSFQLVAAFDPMAVDQVESAIRAVFGENAEAPDAAPLTDDEVPF